MKAHSYFYTTLQLHCEVNHNNPFTFWKINQVDDWQQVASIITFILVTILYFTLWSNIVS